MPEGADFGARKCDAVEQRGMVSGVADNSVSDLQQRAQYTEVGLVAGGEYDRIAGSHPAGDFAFKFSVQIDRAVEQSRPRQRGAVLVKRVLSAGLHPLVG